MYFLPPTSCYWVGLKLPGLSSNTPAEKLSLWKYQFKYLKIPARVTTTHYNVSLYPIDKTIMVAAYNFYHNARKTGANFSFVPPLPSGWSQYRGMFTLGAQSRQKCWFECLVVETSHWMHWFARSVSIWYERVTNSTLYPHTPLFLFSLHSFSSSVTKPDKNRHKSRPFTSNSITEQRRPAIMSELPLLPCINPLRSHAISLDLCVTRDFLALEVQDIQRAKLETSITNYLHESK